MVNNNRYFYLITLHCNFYFSFPLTSLLCLIVTCNDCLQLIIKNILFCVAFQIQISHASATEQSTTKNAITKHSIEIVNCTPVSQSKHPGILFWRSSASPKLPCKTRYPVPTNPLLTVSLFPVHITKSIIVHTTIATTVTTTRFPST